MLLQERYLRVLRGLLCREMRVDVLIDMIEDMRLVLVTTLASGRVSRDLFMVNLDSPLARLRSFDVICS